MKQEERAVTIRIHLFNDGQYHDTQNEFDLSSFGGVIPSAGDLIVNPGVLEGLNRRDPLNREMWEVVRRVFMPHDLSGDYVVLAVRQREVKSGEEELI